MSKITQWAKINSYLRDHPNSSLRELMIHLNINWPAKRISEMRDAGVDIRDYWDESVDEYGEKTQYKRYYLP